MRCEKSKDIWLEDELTEAQKEGLFIHMENCQLCKDEYALKNTFLNTANEYKERCKNISCDSVEHKKPYKKRKLFIPLVAAVMSIFIIMSVVFAKDQLFSFVNFVTENFGWNLAFMQNGATYTKDDFRVSISPIAVSKTNISFAFMINNLKDDKLVISPEDVWLECDGEIYRPTGFAGVSFEKKSGYGELNFNIPDGLKENFVFKIRNLVIHKVDEDRIKKIGRPIEALWDFPINLDRNIIEKANQNYSVYLINKNFTNSDLSMNLDRLEIESSKLVITHTIKESSIIRLGDIKIISEEGNVLSERRYASGKMEYSNIPGKYSTILMNENWPFETVLLPIEEGKPKKLEVDSYLVSELIGEKNLGELIESQKAEIDSINKGKKESDIINEYDKEINVGKLTLKVKVYKNSRIVDIRCATGYQISASLQESGKEVKPIESVCSTTNGFSENEYLFKYDLQNREGKYFLKLFETKEKEIKIEVNLQQN